VPKSDIAVVLVSGGLDSCVTAAEARAAGHALAFLHGNYGQRTEARELRAFHAIADRMGVPRARRLVVSFGHLGAIGGSSLTDRAIPIEVSPLLALPAPGEPADDAASPRRSGGPAFREEASAEGAPAPAAAREGAGGGAGTGRSLVPVSYVPFRNAHFLAAAGSWAEVLGAGTIYIGAVEEDSSGYPDCREAFFAAFERALDLGTRPETRIRIIRPLIHRDKAWIVRRGLDLGAPLELTWSCYGESEEACGVCDSCALRLRGFARAGAVDPIRYAARPSLPERAGA
jgi:7-cyano-7-deazaguanine synthase